MITRNRRNAFLARDSELINTPNRVLEVVADFSLYQLRIYATIIELLHDELKKSFDDVNYPKNANLGRDMLSVLIPLHKISKPTEYRDVKQSIILMTKVNCEIIYYIDRRKQIMSGSLFTVDMPVEANWGSTIKISLHPEVAKLMIVFQRNHLGEPIFYSQFIPGIIQTLRNKHNVKMYIFLCLYRHKELIPVSVEFLYHFLGLNESYKLFSNFKKHILIPASIELAKKGDIWFDIDAPDFFVKKGKTTTHLNFKILTKANIEKNRLKKNQITKLLETHFNFNTSDFEEIHHSLNNKPLEKILDKISDLHEKMTTKTIYSKKYIIASLNNLNNF